MVVVAAGGDHHSGCNSAVAASRSDYGLDVVWKPGSRRCLYDAAVVGTGCVRRRVCDRLGLFAGELADRMAGLQA